MTSSLQQDVKDQTTDEALAAISQFMENATSQLDDALKWGDTDSFLQQAESIAEALNSLVSIILHYGVY